MNFNENAILQIKRAITIAVTACQDDMKKAVKWVQLVNSCTHFTLPEQHHAVI
jgi:hypothetical protein